MIGDDPRFTHHGHERRIAIPAGDEMEMQVVADARSGGFAEVEAYIDALRFEKLRDGLEEFEKVNILRARAAKNPKAKAAVARMDEELSKLFTVEKSRGNSHEEDVRKAREIIRKTTEISR